MIWAHGGYTPYFLARRMIERHPNLTYELSARTYLRHPRSPDYTIFRNETEVWPRWLGLIEANPSFALAYQGLAEAYSRKGELEEAVRSIRKAIEAEPDESLYHTSLSRFLQMQGKVPEAEEAAAVASRLQSRPDF